MSGRDIEHAARERGLELAQEARRLHKEIESHNLQRDELELRLRTVRELMHPPALRSFWRGFAFGAVGLPAAGLVIWAVVSLAIALLSW